MSTRFASLSAFLVSLAVVLFSHRACLAQPPQLYNTLPGGATNHTSWGENIGFVNTHPFSDSCSNVLLRPGLFLYKHAWAENIGWIGFGNIPADNFRYSNTMQGPFLDWGVNAVFDGAQANIFMLSGYGWAENAGWINFGGGALATPPAPAYYSFADKRLHGFAWGENIGWLNLDDANILVSFYCHADFNQDGVITVSDIFAYLSAWFAGAPTAVESVQAVCPSSATVSDIFTFLSSWFGGC